MLCATLMDQRMKPEYSSLLSSPTPPGVNNLKVWIEEAWKSGKYLREFTQVTCIDLLTSGFDPEGAEGLKGKLVGHKKWIGTAGRFVFQSQSISQLIAARARIVRGIHVQRNSVGDPSN
jgi:hypothetical protein